MSHKMLEGIRVVDLTSIIFGPFCTQILADLGADVIKVEAPKGDQFRRAGKPARTKLMGPCHLTLNRGKRSVVFDLKTEDGRASMLALLATADIFVHNVRGKAAGRLGLSYDDVRKVRPDIIYAHCVGFGSGGPYSDLQAYDDVIQSVTGMATLARKVDPDADPTYVPHAIADKVAALYAANAIQAAIIHRLRTGEGQMVEIPMFEAVTQFLLVEHLFGATFVPPTGNIGYPRQLDPTRQPFKTKDGYVSVVPYTDDSWVKLWTIAGRADVLDDPRFNSRENRGINGSLLNIELARMTPQRSNAEWIALFNGAAIPCIAVRDIDDALQDPHLMATGYFRPREHATEGAYLEARHPAKFSAYSNHMTPPAPLLGEHTEEILAELQAAS